jgi:hypothetical protein
MDGDIAEEAARYARLGAPPSPQAEVVDPITTFRRAAIWDPTFATALSAPVERWASQMTGRGIVDAHASGVSLFFHQIGLPFRIDLEAKPLQNSPRELHVEAELAGLARRAAGPIAIRPQTFRDEFLGAFRLRRDLRLGDREFDPLYFVSGTDEALHDFFTPEVRAAFVQIGSVEPASVDIADGIARARLERHRLADICALFGAFSPPA